MAAGDVPQPALYIATNDQGRVEQATIGQAPNGRDIKVPREFTAVFDLEVGTVELDVAAEPGRARVTQLRVSEHAGDGVTGLTVSKISVARLVERAVANMTFMPTPSTMKVAGAATRRRRRVSDNRLQEVAEEHATGGIAGIMESENISERQAYRLLRRAREAGFAEEDDR